MSARPCVIRRPNPTRATRPRPSWADDGPRFLIGVDLGQARDYTAIAIVERQSEDRGAPGSESVEYHLRHLERIALGTPYADAVERVAGLMDSPRLVGRARLLVDGTGVGTPVVEMFRKAGLHPIPIWITGGETTSRKGRIIRVPKRELVSVLQVLLQCQRLKLPRGIPESQLLIQELLAFRAKITSSGSDTYEAWREKDHDDLVLALALTCWYGERMLLKGATNLSIDVMLPNHRG